MKISSHSSGPVPHVDAPDSYPCIKRLRSHSCKVIVLFTAPGRGTAIGFDGDPTTADYDLGHYRETWGEGEFDRWDAAIQLKNCAADEVAIPATQSQVSFAGPGPVLSLRKQSSDEMPTCISFHQGSLAGTHLIGGPDVYVAVHHVESDDDALTIFETPVFQSWLDEVQDLYEDAVEIEGLLGPDFDGDLSGDSVTYDDLAGIAAASPSTTANTEPYQWPNLKVIDSAVAQYERMLTGECSGAMKVVWHVEPSWVSLSIVNPYFGPSSNMVFAHHARFFFGVDLLAPLFIGFDPARGDDVAGVGIFMRSRDWSVI